MFICILYVIYISKFKLIYKNNSIQKKFGDNWAIGVGRGNCCANNIIYRYNTKFFITITQLHVSAHFCILFKDKSPLQIQRIIMYT